MLFISSSVSHHMFVSTSLGDSGKLISCLWSRLIRRWTCIVWNHGIHVKLLTSCSELCTSFPPFILLKKTKLKKVMSKWKMRQKQPWFFWQNQHLGISCILPWITICFIYVIVIVFLFCIFKNIFSKFPFFRYIPASNSGGYESFAFILYNNFWSYLPMPHKKYLWTFGLKRVGKIVFLLLT